MPSPSFTTYNTALIIDDDPINNFISDRVLKHLKYVDQSFMFTGVEPALSFLKSKQLDQILIAPIIAFLDINMPGKNGWDFLEALENLELNTPTLDLYMLSSSIDPADQNKARQYSLVKGYIVKPLTTQKLNSLLMSSPQFVFQ